MPAPMAKDGLLRQRDEDRHAGVQGHGPRRARPHQLRLRARWPPHRAGHGAKCASLCAPGSPAEPGAHRLRTGVNTHTNMNSTKTITKDSLVTLEAYAKIRQSAKPEVIAHRRLRTVPLGEHISVQLKTSTPSGARSRRYCTSKRSSAKPASRAGSRPMRRCCPQAATGRRRCSSNTPTRTSASANSRS
jgi:hypothetical protein